MKKKVLLITYYWPPSGGVAVQRWLKMVKYLSEDFDITVYTPLNPEYPSLDLELEKQIPNNVHILKRKIFEPYGLFRKLTFKSKDYKPKQEFASVKKKTFLDNISVWIRGNFFIPDARKFWIKPSIRFLSKELRVNNFEVIISNGTPHSVHLIALGLKEKFNVKWIADFRDPWTKVDYFKDLKLSKRAEKEHIKKEKKVLVAADLITTVSDSWADDFRKLGAKRVEVLYNGYDNNDFVNLKRNESQKIILSHIGSLNEERNKRTFWRAVQSIIKNNKDIEEKIEIRLIGNLSAGVEKYIEEYEVMQYVDCLGNVPHRNAVQEMLDANILLLFLGDLNDFGRIPAKIFEYMATKNPVFAITSKRSDVANIITENDSGVICGDSYNEIKSSLLELIKCQNNYRVNRVSDSYSRKSISLELKEFIKTL